MDEFIKILLLLSLSGTLFLLIIWVLKYFYKKIFQKKRIGGRGKKRRRRGNAKTPPALQKSSV